MCRLVWSFTKMRTDLELYKSEDWFGALQKWGLIWSITVWEFSRSGSNMWHIFSKSALDICRQWSFRCESYTIYWVSVTLFYRIADRVALRSCRNMYGRKPFCHMTPHTGIYCKYFHLLSLKNGVFLISLTIYTCTAFHMKSENNLFSTYKKCLWNKFV